MSDATTLPAERALMGAILVNPEIFSEVALIVREEDFGDADLATAFGTMHKLVIDQKSITMATMASSGSVALMPHLLACLEDPSPSHWPEYAQIISDSGRRRQLLLSLRRIVTAPPSGGLLDLSAAVAKVQQQAEAGITSGAMRWMDAGNSALEKLGREVEKRETSGQAPGMPWCLPWLQRLTGGMYDGEFIVLAGRPGNGKSALLNQQAMYLAKRKLPGILISLEMQQEMLMQRALSHEGRINASEIRAADRTAYESACAAFVDIADYQIWIDTQAQHIAQIVASITLAKQKHNIRWAAFDHMQLVEAPGSTDLAQLSYITRSIKLLAMKLGIPIIGLSQMSRAIESSDRFPRMSDLRSSGTIEQDADSVIFIHKKTNGPDTVQHYLGVEKGRSSDTAWTDQNMIEFEGQYQTFREMEPHVRESSIYN